MALESTTYGTLARVEDMTEDLIEGRQFTTSTFPTADTVERFLDARARTLNMLLDAMGYASPVVEATHERAFDSITEANNMGAALDVMALYPGFTNLDGQVSGKGRMYQSQWDLVVGMIKDGTFPADQSSIETVRGKMLVGGRFRSDGTKKKPMFTKRQHEYPSIREGSADVDDD